MAISMWRFGWSGLALTAALAGCGGPTPVAQTAPAPAVSYDGQYRGTVHLTGVGSGTDRSWCDSNTTFAVDVVNNAFTFTQTHPGLPNAPPVTYSAAIARDGTLQGQSGVTGQITGQIEGSTMTGDIDGIGCAYKFSATRF